MGKTTDKTTVPVGALIPQPHGGALRNGGTNKGGLGQPRSRIRERMIGSLSDRIHIAEEIIDADDTAERDKLAGLAFLAKFGGMEQKGAVTVDAELLNKFFTVIELHIQDDVVLADIREKWLDVLADRVGAR